MINRWPFEQKLKIGLGCAAISFLGLIVLVLHAWQWSWLAIYTTLFLLSYPVVFVCWRTWRSWISPLMRLSVYSQALAAGDKSIRPSHKGRAGLIDHLFDEIHHLGSHQYAQQLQLQNIHHTFCLLFDNLPMCIWGFDEADRLFYVNTAAMEVPDMGSLLGSHGSDLGFSMKSAAISHSALAKGWQCQNSELILLGQRLQLLSALNISVKLQENEQAVQNNLVRVLSHELRNSLTPMSSLADTLLSMPTLNEQQVRMVLERVRDRADSLLGFVQRFSSVAKIPEANYRWFLLDDVIEQAELMLGPSDTLNTIGTQRCYADPELMAQALVNLVKNAVEAIREDTSENSGKNRSASICIRYALYDQWQQITVEDNGPGFTNPDNALTPLFTTKPQGAGIGLALVGAILNKHQGHITLGKASRGGAKVELTWPLNS